MRVGRAPVGTGANAIFRPVAQVRLQEMKWKSIFAGICGFAFGFWLCMPRDTVLLPRYEVLVADAAGKGLAGAEVKQSREDYAISGNVSSSLTSADSYGRAAFPAVRGRTSPLLRLIMCGRRMVTLGVHAPCGYRFQIVAEVPGYAEASRSESKLPLKGRGRLLRITMRQNTP
ncbi:MAG: hypothetical protein ABI147_08665 [Acidobacteriaceae bacterium]